MNKGKRPKRRREIKAEYDGKTPLADPKQELFCVLYTSNTAGKFFGHGQNSYAFAYDYQARLDYLHEQLPVAARTTGRGKKKKPSAYSLAEVEIKKIENTCRSCATRLLISANIKLRCDFLMDKLAAHLIVDRELLYTIQQRFDLNSKVQAIKHHDQREARIREKIDLKHEFEPIEGFKYVTPESIKKK